MTTMTERVRSERHPRQSATVASKATTVGVARRILREACAQWGLDQGATETGTLLISEIVTNAVRHGRSHSIRVIVELPRPDRLRIAAVDRSRHTPEVRIVGPDSVGGRGLLLVDALSDRWGTDLLPWGKRVWAEITATPGG
ncbi:ATP-binding protein [Streptomyces sp. ODS05-4]|uniref:ATP-binding protein n=1 Tax=Streptomyces sp. ODS05-4 TaxID=2944939 RepID=UPI00210B7DAD|nr:ATP-binding protein [Streptomyces sp. ODS05-4]